MDGCCTYIGCSVSTRLEGTESAAMLSGTQSKLLVAASRPAWRVLKGQRLRLLSRQEPQLQRLDPLGGY